MNNNTTDTIQIYDKIYEVQNNMLLKKLLKEAITVKQDNKMWLTLREKKGRQKKEV